MDRNVLVTVNSDPACQKGVMDRNVLVTVNSDPACQKGVMERNVLVTVNSDPACQNGVMDRNVLVTVNSDPACHTILLHRRSRSFQKSSTVLTSLQKRDLCNKTSMVQIHNSREKQKLPVKVASHHAATSAPLTSGTGTDPSLSSTPSCHRHTVVAEGLEVVSMLL